MKERVPAAIASMGLPDDKITYVEADVTTKLGGQLVDMCALQAVPALVLVDTSKPLNLDAVIGAPRVGLVTRFELVSEFTKALDMIGGR